MEKRELDIEKIKAKDHKKNNRNLRIEWKRWLALLFLILFTFYDILIADGLFNRLQIRHNMPIFYTYWILSYVFLIPFLIVLISLKLRSWQFLMYSVVGIYCGWLDIFFFLFQGESLPEVYTWWPLSPTNFQLITFATASLIIALFIDFIDFKVKDLSLSIITGSTKVKDN